MATDWCSKTHQCPSFHQSWFLNLWMASEESERDHTVWALAQWSLGCARARCPVSPALMQHLGWHLVALLPRDGSLVLRAKFLLNVPWVVDKEIHDEWRDEKKETGQRGWGQETKPWTLLSLLISSSPADSFQRVLGAEPTESRIKDSGAFSPWEFFLGFFLTLFTVFVHPSHLNSVPRAFNNHIIILILISILF